MQTIKINMAKAKRDTEQFNRLFPVGTSMKYYAIKGHPGFTWVQTRSKAWPLDSGQVIVKITGASGGVSIDNLKQE